MACAVCVLSKLARVQSEKNGCFCFRFSIIWKVEATSNSPHFLFIWTLPSSCSFWHCVPAWLTLKLRININISCFVSHPDHPGQISCGENDSLNYRSLAPVRQDVRHRTAHKQPRGLKGVGREVWLHEKQTKMFWAKVFWKTKHTDIPSSGTRSPGGE